MARLDERVRKKLALPALIADAFVGRVLVAGGKGVNATVLSIEAGGALEGGGNKIEALERLAHDGLTADLPVGKVTRRPFHWPLEFPEVFNRENAGDVLGIARDGASGPAGPISRHRLQEDDPPPIH
jgi:hypothetical protein